MNSHCIFRKFMIFVLGCMQSCPWVRAAPGQAGITARVSVDFPSWSCWRNAFHCHLSTGNGIADSHCIPPTQEKKNPNSRIKVRHLSERYLFHTTIKPKSCKPNHHEVWKYLLLQDTQGKNRTSASNLWWFFPMKKSPPKQLPLPLPVPSLPAATWVQTPRRGPMLAPSSCLSSAST